MKQDVRCIRECVDSKLPRHYVPGDRDDIDPMSDHAQYFDGWAPGTVIKIKVKGNKETPATSGTRRIPGGLVLDEEDLGGEKTELLCDICGKGGWKSTAGLATHRISCAKKQDK